jgi:hypothetical protein
MRVFNYIYHHCTTGISWRDYFAPQPGDRPEDFKTPEEFLEVIFLCFLVGACIVGPIIFVAGILESAHTGGMILVS